jgi:hypothetical protein
VHAAKQMSDSSTGGCMQLSRLATGREACRAAGEAYVHQSVVQLSFGECIVALDVAADLHGRLVVLRVADGPLSLDEVCSWRYNSSWQS